MPKASVARSPLPADKPVTPLLKQRLTTELEAAHSAIDAVDSLIHVCNMAWRHQDCDVDGDVADVLDEDWSKLSAARDSVMNATNLVSEVADG